MPIETTETGIVIGMAYYEGFEAVEAMQAASEAAGWQCEYRQIDAGQLQATTVYQPVGKSSLIRETANRRLDITARTPSAAVTVLVPLPGTQALINGRRLSDDRLMVLAPDIDFHAGSNSGAEVWSVHLPTELLDAGLDGVDFGTLVIDGQTSSLAKLRNAITGALAIEDEQLLNFHETHIADVTQSILSSDDPAPRVDRYHRRQKRKSLARSLEFIEAHLTTPVRMGQICSYAGVSQSTLERLFQREYQQTPSSFVRARRLDAVRRDLGSGLETGTIAEVAMKHGFTHMGRFSSAYRKQFGHLPSENSK